MTSFLNTPVGELVLEVCGGFVTRVDSRGGCKQEDCIRKNCPHRNLDGLTETDAAGAEMADRAVMEQCKIELLQYFDGMRKEFSVPVKLEGTEFRKACWAQLQKIPYGETASYKDVAVAVGNPKAVRAVGGANHRNPVMIIVPCHRVVGSNGALTGFGGGLEMKAWLLDHERKGKAVAAIAGR